MIKQTRKTRDDLFNFQELRKDLLHYQSSRGISTEKLSRLMDIAAYTLRRFLQGTHKPYSEVTFRIINFLKENNRQLGEHYGTKIS